VNLDGDERIGGFYSGFCRGCILFYYIFENCEIMDFAFEFEEIGMRFYVK
jgi:hypothetical protein